MRGWSGSVPGQFLQRSDGASSSRSLMSAQTLMQHTPVHSCPTNRWAAGGAAQFSSRVHVSTAAAPQLNSVVRREQVLRMTEQAVKNQVVHRWYARPVFFVAGVNRA